MGRLRRHHVGCFVSGADQVDLVAASGLLADHGAAQRLELVSLHGLRDDHVWLRYHIRADR